MADSALITGATGLIGAHVLQNWDLRDLEPRCTDRRSDDLLTLGAARQVVTRMRPAVVVHLAWSASGTPDYRTSPDNERWVDASLELRDAASAVGSRFVALGTALDTEPLPSDAYSASKVRLRGLLEPAIQSGEIAWVRPYYVFDPDRRRPALVAQAVAAESGEDLVLRTPLSRHDFVHAADVARAVVLAVRERLTGEIPVGSGRLRTVSELVAALGAGWVRDQSAGQVADHHHQPADIERLVALGWSPTSTEELFAGE